MKIVLIGPSWLPPKENSAGELCRSGPRSTSSTGEGRRLMFLLSGPLNTTVSFPEDCASVHLLILHHLLFPSDELETRYKRQK